VSGRAQAPGRADLIIRALSGHHLHGFLPGNGNRAAISRAVSSGRSWSGPLEGWGEVRREGIGLWPHAIRLVPARPADAMLFLPWDEVLAVIARGCADGYRERYEAAHAAWCTAVHEASKDYRAGQVAWVDQSGIDETKAALIRHGCEEPAQVLVQGALF
jgi:hypothetical protein